MTNGNSLDSALKIIKGIIFGIFFLIAWQISKISLGLWGIVIFLAIILLTIFLSKKMPPPTPTPAIARAKSVLGTILTIAVAILAIYAFLVISIPLFKGFAYGLNSPEGFEDNSTPYTISGNCRIIEQEELFVDGNCVITRSLVDDNPWIVFPISVPDNEKVKITTVFYDSDGRTVNFKPMVIDSSATEYRAEIKWAPEAIESRGIGNYFPVASVGLTNGKEVKETACSLGSGKLETKKYMIKTVISGFAFIDDLESPYGSIEWKLNPFS